MRTPAAAPLVDDVGVPVDGEPLDDRLGDARPDALDGGELVLLGGANALEVAELRASAWAAVGPTCRIDSATSTRHSGWVLAASRFCTSLWPLADSTRPSTASSSPLRAAR